MFFYTLTLFFFVFQIPLNKFRDIDWLYDFFFLSVEEPSSFSRSLKKNGVKGSGGIALSSKILGRTKFRSLEIFERSEKNIPRVFVNGIKEGFISYHWSTCRLSIASSSPDESLRRFNLSQQELVERILHERDLSTCFLAFDIPPQEREQVRGWLLIFGKEIAGELIEKPRGEADVALFTRLLLRDNVHRVQLHLDENSSDSLHSPQDLSIFCENSVEIYNTVFTHVHNITIGK